MLRDMLLVLTINSNGVIHEEGIMLYDMPVNACQQAGQTAMLLPDVIPGLPGKIVRFECEVKR